MMKLNVVIALLTVAAGCATAPHSADLLDVVMRPEQEAAIVHLRENNPDLFMQWVQRLTDAEWRSGEAHPVSAEFGAFLSTYSKEHHTGTEIGQHPGGR